MNTRVSAWGHPNSKLVLVGEAPGKHELRLGRPFVGPSGHTLDKWWSDVGLRRSDFYIINVYEYRAPGDKIDKAPHDEVEEWAATLHARLACLTDPWLIVPTGNIALRALMQRPLWRNDSPKITDWRGSIMSVRLNGTDVKMIPTIHPAATFRQPSLAKLCRADWARIATEARTPDIKLPERTHVVPPIPGRELQLYLDNAQNTAEVLAIDIETNPETRTILCVGFSDWPSQSLTLPWPEYRHEIKALCESPCEKVLQNGHYDCFWLSEEGIRVRNWKWDTLAMHHAIDAAMPHDLATMASLYTRQPYWKKSQKDVDSPTALKEPLERLYIYNGIDCCVTRELYDVFKEKLNA